MKSTIFWDTMPCSPLKVNWHFGETYRLHLQCRISWATYQRESRWQAYSTLKMETICSSETSVDFQRTTWRYIPEDSILQSVFCDPHVFAHNLDLNLVEVWYRPSSDRQTAQVLRMDGRGITSDGVARYIMKQKSKMFSETWMAGGEWECRLDGFIQRWGFSFMTADVSRRDNLKLKVEKVRAFIGLSLGVFLNLTTQFSYIFLAVRWWSSDNFSLMRYFPQT
jgi:hypothetical protein